MVVLQTVQIVVTSGRGMILHKVARQCAAGSRKIERTNGHQHAREATMPPFRVRSLDLSRVW